MEYRRLGRTGIDVSELCLGCWMLGKRTPEPEGLQMVDRALDMGINFLDTANAYSAGRSEELIGKALAREGKRERVVLATKVGWPLDDGPNSSGISRRHIIEQCEASLRRLQTDWIDLYQVHRPASHVPIDETLRALDDLVKAGKVRYIGTSTFASWQLVESLWASEELCLNRFVTEQPPYHLLDRSIERELVPMAQTYGIALLPWSPLARGFLTGKYRRGEAPPPGSRLTWDNAPREQQLFSSAAFDVLDVVRDLAAEKECTPSQVALAWVLRQPGVTSPIIGPRTVEQLEDNVGACSVTLTPEDHARLDRVAPPRGVIAEYYHADFGPHKHRW